MRQLSRVHIPGASAAGPLTPSVPCALSLFRPIVHPDICQVGPAGDRPLYARYVDGHVTDNVPGRVIASSRVRVWVPYPKFPEEPGTHPRFPKEPGGYRARSSRAPRSGVGLVPVAVNDYSPQKCRCARGACLVSAGVPPASVGYGGSL